MPILQPQSFNRSIVQSFSNCLHSSFFIIYPNLIRLFRTSFTRISVSRIRRSFISPYHRSSRMSTPEPSRLSHLTVETGISNHSGKSSGKSSGTEEEDEDIPLAILAAHGFPNRNKPPSRLQTSTSTSNLTGSYPLSAPPQSVSGESRTGSRGNLPIFARNLPQDPHYNAGMVSPPSREQFSMGGGMSPYGGVSPGQVHPSGLVGVIAGEERARAMRRGSPNHVNQEQFIPGQHPGMMGRSQTMGAIPNMNGYPGPGMPLQSLSLGDQAQIQMAHQMQQMMHMQMQWMQQITQIQQSGRMQQMGQMGQLPQPPHPGMVPMPNFMPSPGEMGNLIPRPYSMPLPESPRPNGRAMSFTPGMANQWNRKSSYAPSMNGGGGGGGGSGVQGGGYAPSIAPSERNTVGMASRYRPVSIVAESMKLPSNQQSNHSHHNNRPPTLFPSTTLSPPETEPQAHQIQPSDPGRLSPTHTITNTNAATHPASHSELARNGGGAGRGSRSSTPKDDEDDDQGWTDMKKKRDKKRSLWRMRRRGEKVGGL